MKTCFIAAAKSDDIFKMGLLTNFFSFDLLDQFPIGLNNSTRNIQLISCFKLNIIIDTTTN